MHRRVVQGLIAFVVAVSVAACSSPPATAPTVTASASVLPPSAASSAALATATPRPSRPPGPGDVVYQGRIDIGGNRSMEVRCVGVGAPTILLEGGGITPRLDQWPRENLHELGLTTTTCAYSRGGGGTSSAPVGTRTMAGVVDDAFKMLAALKQTAGVPGPYILVGTSFGGEVALAEALAHPDQVKGLVILDTDFPRDPIPTCRMSGRSAAECQQAYDDDIAAASLEHELAPNIHALPEIPLRIISAMEFPECDPSKPETLHAYIGPDDVRAKDCPDLANAFAVRQLKGWSTINPKLEQTRVDADHDGLVERAGDEIARIVLDLVKKARANP